MLLGGVILAVFLIVVFVAGYFLYKFKNARLASAWGPLVALVNGQITGDGGGGATSWLTGTYRGRPVIASLSPNINQHDEGGSKYNYFEVALPQTPGKHDWSVAYNRAVLGVGQNGWQVKAEDAALAAALRATAVESLVAPFGETPTHFMRPSLEYSRRERLLRYRTDITPRVAPTPEQFTQLMDMLLSAAAVNEQLNPP
jgi:hypothetical protein